MTFLRKTVVACSVAVTALLVGCSSDPGSKFVGYWEDAHGSHRMIHIYESGENYFIRDNIIDIYAKDVEKEKQDYKKKPGMPLTVKEDKVSIEYGRGSIPLVLNGEGNLVVDNNELKKIDEARIDELFAKVAEDRKNCNALVEEYKAIETKFKNDPATKKIRWGDRSTKLRELQKPVKDKMGEIQRCSSWGM